MIASAGNHVAAQLTGRKFKAGELGHGEYFSFTAQLLPPL